MAKGNRKEMATYQFALILAGIKGLTPDVTDALYEAGFDDALVGMAAGVPYIDVNHRQGGCDGQSTRLDQFYRSLAQKDHLK